MKEVSIINNNNNNSTLTIQHNDKSVQIDPTQPISIKWTNGKNGLKSADTKKATKHLNLDLPKVNCRRVEWMQRAAMPRPFKMPSLYVQSVTEEEEANGDDDDTEYDLDREDLAWLQLANARRQTIGCPPIDECTLEKAIDMLEKESHFQFTQDEHGYRLDYLSMIDDDAPCCICNDGEDSNANQIIFCDICNIAVHQECYGVPYIPEGQWLCRRCQMSPSVPVNCALCPCTSGAFKQTSDGRWVHVVCAIWLNEVHFANTVFLEPVEGVDFSVKRRHKLTCLICKRKVGACLQCSNKACVRSFHATCARYADMKMVVKESRARNNSDSITINRFAYCFQHSNPNKNGQSVTVWKREMDAKLKTARKTIDTSAKKTLKSVPLPVIPREKVYSIAQTLGLNYMNDIYSYWSLKRKSRSGVPLIRRLQVYMNQQKPMLGRPFGDDENAVDAEQLEAKAVHSSPMADEPAMAEAQIPAPTGSATLDDTIKYFAGLRRNFERVRLLCELIKKREKMKRDLLSTQQAIVCKTMRPLQVLIDQTLAKLIEKDHQQVFTEPVNERQAVPECFATLPQPMDFQQMRANLDKGRYKRIADLRDDFLLMLQNSIAFNKNNTHIYNYGQRIRRIGISVIKTAEDEELRMNEFSTMKGHAVTNGLPTLSTEASLFLYNEFKFHNKEMMASTESDAKMPTIATTSRCLLESQQDSANNRLKKSADRRPTLSHGVSSTGGKTAAATHFTSPAEKKLATPKRAIAAKSGNTEHILSEQEKSNQDNDAKMTKKLGEDGGGSASSRLKRSHSKASGGTVSMSKTPRTASVGKGGATPSITPTSKNIIIINDDDEPQQQLEQQMSATKRRRTITRSSSSNNKATTMVMLNNCNNNNGDDEQKQQKMVKEQKQQRLMPSAATNNSSSSIRRRSSSKIINGDKKEEERDDDDKGIGQRMSGMAILSPKRQSTATMVCCNINNSVVRKKQTYANAYQTEASSAAESDSGQCDDEQLLLFCSMMPDEQQLYHQDDYFDDADELPSTAEFQTAPRLRRRHSDGRTTMEKRRKYFQIDNNDAVPPSPTTASSSSSFTHNDIVMVQDFKFPGRVIDIRMRAIDLEDEDEEDDDSSGGVCRRSNGKNNGNSSGVGRHFIDHALGTKPSQNEMGSQQQHTLILFFDTHHTCKWIPNAHIRLLYEYDLNSKTLRTEKDRTVVEAFERAKRFWQSVIHP